MVSCNLVIAGSFSVASRIATSLGSETGKSRLTVVSHEAKEEVPCDGLLTNAREYCTRTNFVKIKM